MRKSSHTPVEHSESFEVLLSTVDQLDLSLLDKMNIQSDIVFINQATSNEISTHLKDGMKVRLFTLAERGVGLSRNTALDRAEADIVLFADDDVVYHDGYVMTVLSEFRNLPDADVIIFNLDPTEHTRTLRQNSKQKRVHWSALNFGMPRVAVRVEKVRTAGIRFSLLFGGGARYSSGEDTLFIAECIKHNLKIYTSTRSIGDISFANSSWYSGISPKYMYDRGALFAALWPKFWPLLGTRFIARHWAKIQNSMAVSVAIRELFLGGRNYTRSNSGYVE